MTRPEAVLLQVLTQDASVIVGGKHPLQPIQPVVAHAGAGFWEGPACERVAVVDLLAADGSSGSPVALDPKGSRYRGVARYRTSVPKVPGAGTVPWADGSAPSTTLDRLGTGDDGDAFVKVSVFGSVIRAIGFVEDPVVLGRRVDWAFPGSQILVVPSAGIQPNAFYHRDSGSLRFFSFPAPGEGDTLVHSALSQDIVTHETTHALIDGIAPDLYDSVGPDGLAIHESVADLAAAMISLRNRDAGFRDRATPDAAIRALTRSSRYSRIAEQFGRSRGHGDALRDALNQRTLHSLARNPRRVVDPISPHSLSEVMTGTLFAVLVRSIGASGVVTLSHRGDPFRITSIRAANRIGGLVFRGLDWLPPGEATYADFALAMLVADEFHRPDGPDERAWLVDELVRRGVANRTELKVERPTLVLDKEFRGRRLTAANAGTLRRLVDGNRAVIGMPDVPFDVAFHRCYRSDEPLLQPRHVAESVSLDEPGDALHGPGDLGINLLKVAWWSTQVVTLPVDRSASFAVRVGATLAIDDDGRVLAVLRGNAGLGAARRRGSYLQRKVADGSVGSGRTLGDDRDHEEDWASVRASVEDGTIRLSGSFQTLHIDGSQAAGERLAPLAAPIPREASTARG